MITIHKGSEVIVLGTKGEDAIADALFVYIHELPDCSERDEAINLLKLLGRMK